MVAASTFHMILTCTDSFELSKCINVHFVLFLMTSRITKGLQLSNPTRITKEGDLGSSLRCRSQISKKCLGLANGIRLTLVGEEYLVFIGERDLMSY